MDFCRIFDKFFGVMCILTALFLHFLFNIRIQFFDFLNIDSIILSLFIYMSNFKYEIYIADRY